jgi:hypothetical protein
MDDADVDNRVDGGSDRLETIVAILIAIAVLVGAWLAWRASVADDGAGDADFAGLRAVVNAEETRSLNAVQAFDNYGAYTSYKRYSELGDLIERDLEGADEDAAEVLDRERASAQDLATANQSLFPNEFLNRDGSYSVSRNLGQLWADAAKERDLNPDPQFKEADALRNKSNLLLATITILALAIVFYTLVETFGSRMRYVMVALGSILLIVGTAAGVYVETSM